MSDLAHLDSAAKSPQLRPRNQEIHHGDAETSNEVREGSVRNQIACQMCRQHKQRCVGGSPCANCAHRGVLCVYRTKMRPGRKPRTIREIKPKDPALKQPSNAFPSVRATQHISATCISELYYGPSSNFSLMQQLYRELEHDGGRLQRRIGGVQDAGEGLDEFQYRKVCFHSQLTKFDSSGHYDMPIDHPKYLKTYFDVIGVPFPVITESELDKRLAHLHSSEHVYMDPIHRAVLLAAIAIGALFCNAKEEGELLLQTAQTIADKSRYTINTEVVILNYLMITYATFHNCTGRYNLAYLQNGHACRLAHAVGLHKTISEASNQATAYLASHGIYWTLFVQESFLCTALGRPTSLQPEESDATEPEELPLLKCFVKLAKISLSIKKMHQDTDQSLETFSKTCNQLVRDLHGVARYADESLGIDIGQQMQVNDCGMPFVLLKLEYELAMMLVHRPLLILWTVSMRFNEHAKGTNVVGRVTAVSKVEGVNKAVEAARHLILIADQILLHEHHAAHFTKISYYLESACFVLIFDSMNSKQPVTVNSYHVETAVEALAKLNNRTNMVDMIVGIRTMLDRALVSTLSTMVEDRNLPSQCSSTLCRDLREVTKVVENGLELTDQMFQQSYLNTEAQSRSDGPNGSVSNSDSSTSASQVLLQIEPLSQLDMALDWFMADYLG